MRTFYAAILAMAASFTPLAAFAAPSGDITITPSSGVAPYKATLTWNVKEVVNCTAYDAWTGAKPVSGTQEVTVTTSTKFTLTCATSTGTSLTTWSPVTTKADGTALTDLAGYNVYRGLTASSLDRIGSVGPSTTSYSDSNLLTGTYYYAVTAVDALSRESDLSQRAMKQIAGSLWTKSAVANVIAAPPPPAPPTNVVTTEVTAYEYKPGTKSFARVGIVPLGATCGPETMVVGGAKYCRLDVSKVDLVNWPSKLPLAEVWAKTQS